ncbi:MAG: tripartite tricarboxylate transporter substrate binding protein [Reyranellaceae bacterium]
MVGLSRRNAIAGLVSALAAPRAWAATWPERPVTWIVPFPRGTSADLYARPVAELASKRLGQPMTIDNRTGGGGTMAATLFARAEPNGYTLMVGYTGLTYASIIYPKTGAGFDFARDFVPIGALAREPLVLAVNPGRLDVADLQQFIAKAKAKPKAIEVSSDGPGTISHLAFELLEERAGLQFTQAPSRGGALAIDALLTRLVDAAFLPPRAVADPAAAGRIRVLAIAGRRRDPVLPNVPTFTEAGLADFRVSQWFGLFAPRGTPEPVLDIVHGTLQAALAEPQIEAQWDKQGARVELESRADFARFVAQEITRWSTIARAAKLTLE